MIKDKNDKLLCYSLPKSIEYKEFQNKYELKDEDVIVTEIIEGTMINVFYDEREEKWKIYSAIFNQYVDFYHDELLKNENCSIARDFLKNRSFIDLDLNDSDHIEKVI